MPSQAYSAAAKPLLDAAAARGMKVMRVVELRRWGARAEPLLAELIAALDQTDSLELVEELASVLSGSWAREAALKPLITRFRSAPNSPPSVKAALAQAIEAQVDERAIDALVELVRERRHGNARAVLVNALGRLDHPLALDTLVVLLADPGVGGHALSALANFVPRTRETIERALVKPFLADGRAWVRRDAKELLNVLDQLA